MLDYELEVRVDRRWKRLERIYGIHNIQNLGFLAPDGTEINIANFAENLIYRRNASSWTAIPT